MSILSHVAVLRWWNLSLRLLNVAGSSCDAAKVAAANRVKGSVLVVIQILIPLPVTHRWGM